MPQRNRLTRPQLRALLKEAGRAPKKAGRATVGELLALCKQHGLVSCGELLHLDDPMLRIILHKKAQTVGADPTILFTLEAVCKTFRDILRDPSEVSIWEEAWQSYKASGAAVGDGIDSPGGTARQRCLLLTVRGCTVCGKARMIRGPIWPFLQRCCGACLRAKTITVESLQLDYNVSPRRLVGLPYYKKAVVCPPWIIRVDQVVYWRDDVKPILREMYGTGCFEEAANVAAERMMMQEYEHDYALYGSDDEGFDDYNDFENDYENDHGIAYDAWYGGADEDPYSEEEADLSDAVQVAIPIAPDDPAWSKWQGGMTAAAAPGAAPQAAGAAAGKPRHTAPASAAAGIAAAGGSPAGGMSGSRDDGAGPSGLHEGVKQEAAALRQGGGAGEVAAGAPAAKCPRSSGPTTQQAKQQEPGPHVTLSAPTPAAAGSSAASDVIDLT